MTGPRQTNGKRAQNREANRAALLEAARQCFVDPGYDAVTVRDVIRRSGLATGTFYNYFQEKEDLLRALIEDHLAVLSRELHEVRSQARSLHDFVEGIYRAAFTAIDQQPELYRLLLRNEAVVRGLYRESPLGVSIRGMREDIADAIRRGIMPPLDVELLAAALFGAGYEMGRVLAERQHKDPSGAAAFATRLFLGGIQVFASDKPTPLKPRVRAVSR